MAPWLRAIGLGLLAALPAAGAALLLGALVALLIGDPTQGAPSDLPREALQALWQFLLPMLPVTGLLLPLMRRRGAGRAQMVSAGAIAGGLAPLPVWWLAGPEGDWMLVLMAIVMAPASALGGATGGWLLHRWL